MPTYINIFCQLITNSPEFGTNFAYRMKIWLKYKLFKKKKFNGKYKPNYILFKIIN